MMKKVWLLVVISIAIASCGNDDNGSPETNDDNESTENDDNGSAEIDTQDFMWKAMNQWYFWQQDVAVLADDRFGSQQEYENFLSSEPNPDSFIRSLLFNQDRFTFWNEDYSTLVNNLSGISQNNGMEFGLVRFSNSDDIFGYVRYILPNSDAAAKNIKRGDLFTRVDGQVLNINNYIDLLFGDNATYRLGMAQINGDNIEDLETEVSLTKEQNFLEDPIHIAKTLEVNGTKVAYLMYNGFRRDFDEQLNNAFGQFLADGATELVLDLRYNSGGSVNSSRLLSSMIYGPNTNELYIRQRWNDKLMQAFSAESLEDYFADNVNGAALNSMRLSKVYVLTTDSSASASELVINALEPYVDVIQIGETTRGKNEFSITLVDDPNRNGAPYVYSPQRENQINPNNSWAIQPLVGRNENAEGFFDYTTGLNPDIALEEDLANLGVLGEPTEPLLARALQEITGLSAKVDFGVKMPANAFTNSKMFTPLKDNMYLDKELDFSKVQR